MASPENVKLTRTTSVGEGPGTVTVPQQVGPVRLLREIGHGAMGTVWLGRHQLLGHEVAVKFLLNAVAGPDDPGFARFIAGARAAAAIRHPGLNPILNADLVAGVPYLVMEYVDGPSLDELIRRTGPLGVPATLAALETICGAVAELHDRDIVHRDIKPGNVLLDAAGRPFVADFGLACTRPTRGTGRLAGTPAYMAPEMFDGVVSPRSDVYALGITTWELLTGDAPFSGTLEELRHRQRTAPLPLEALQQSGVDSRLIDVLTRATHKDTLFRHKTARHFLRAVQDAYPDPAHRSTGAHELALRVTRWRDASRPPPAAADSSSSSYFDRLAERASHRRQDSPTATVPRRDEPQPPPTGEPFSGPTLLLDLLCVHCGYNLRGLTADRRCPECGAAAADSFSRERLMFAPQSWLKTVWRGQRVVYVALGGWLAGSLLAAVSVALLAALNVEVPTLLISIGLASGGLTLAVVVACTLGVLWMTAREPDSPIPERRLTHRRIVRLTLPAAICTGPALLVLSWAEVFRSALLFRLWGVLALTGAFALLLHCAALAARIPDRRLARRVRRAGGFWTTILLVLAAAELLSWRYVPLALLSPVLPIVAVLLALDLCLLVSYQHRALKRVWRQRISRTALFGGSDPDR